eukprot:scaffold6213_cov44-Attheya_sp.AAC.1
MDVITSSFEEALSLEVLSRQRSEDPDILMPVTRPSPACVVVNWVDFQLDDKASQYGEVSHPFVEAEKDKTFAEDSRLDFHLQTTDLSSQSSPFPSFASLTDNAAPHPLEDFMGNDKTQNVDFDAKSDDTFNETSIVDLNKRGSSENKTKVTVRDLRTIFSDEAAGFSSKTEAHDTDLPSFSHSLWADFQLDDKASQYGEVSHPFVEAEKDETFAEDSKLDFPFQTTDVSSQNSPFSSFASLTDNDAPHPLEDFMGNDKTQNVVFDAESDDTLNETSIVDLNKRGSSENKTKVTVRDLRTIFSDEAAGFLSKTKAHDTDLPSFSHSLWADFQLDDKASQYGEVSHPFVQAEKDKTFSEDDRLDFPLQTTDVSPQNSLFPSFASLTDNAAPHSLEDFMGNDKTQNVDFDAKSDDTFNETSIVDLNKRGSSENKSKVTVLDLRNSFSYEAAGFSSKTEAHDTDLPSFSHSLSESEDKSVVVNTSTSTSSIFSFDTAESSAKIDAHQPLAFLSPENSDGASPENADHSTGYEVSILPSGHLRVHHEGNDAVTKSRSISSGQTEFLAKDVGSGSSDVHLFHGSSESDCDISKDSFSSVDDEQITLSLSKICRDPSSGSLNNTIEIDSRCHSDKSDDNSSIFDVLEESLTNSECHDATSANQHECPTHGPKAESVVNLSGNQQVQGTNVVFVIDLEGDIPGIQSPVKEASVKEDVVVDIGSPFRLPKGPASYFMGEEESFSTPKVKNGRTRITNIETPATPSPEISSNIFHSLTDWSARSPLAIVHGISENILGVNTLENAQERSRQVEHSRSEESETSDPRQVANKSSKGEHDVVGRCNLDLETETQSFPTANGISKRRVRSLSYDTAKKSIIIRAAEFLYLDDLVGSFSTNDTGNIDEVNEEKNTTADMLLKSEREARRNLRERKCRKVQAYSRRHVQREKGQTYSTCGVGKAELGSKDKYMSTLSLTADARTPKTVLHSPPLTGRTITSAIPSDTHFSSIVPTLSSQKVKPNQNVLLTSMLPSTSLEEKTPTKVKDRIKQENSVVSLSSPSSVASSEKSATIVRPISPISSTGSCSSSVQRSTPSPASLNQSKYSDVPTRKLGAAIASRISTLTRIPPDFDGTIMAPLNSSEASISKTTSRPSKAAVKTLVSSPSSFRKMGDYATPLEAYSTTVKNPRSSLNEQRRVYQEKQTYNGSEGGLTQPPMTSWKENIAPKNKLETEGRKKKEMTELTKSTMRFQVQNVTPSVSPRSGDRSTQKPVASPPQNKPSTEGRKKNQATERSNSTMRLQVQNVTASVSPRSGDRSTQKPIASPPQLQKETLSAAPTKKLAVGIASRISAMNLS